MDSSSPILAPSPHTSLSTNTDSSLSPSPKSSLPPSPHSSLPPSPHTSLLTSALAALREEVEVLPAYCQGGERLQLHRGLFTLYSPLLRGILASLPPNTTHALSLPEVSRTNTKMLSSLVYTYLICLHSACLPAGVSHLPPGPVLPPGYWSILFPL